MATKKDKKVKKPKVRIWTANYGLTKGHCATAENVAAACASYLIKNQQRKAVIEGPDGPVCDVYRSSFWGLQMVPRHGHGSKAIDAAKIIELAAAKAARRKAQEEAA